VNGRKISIPHARIAAFVFANNAMRKRMVREDLVVHHKFERRITHRGRKIRVARENTRHDIQLMTRKEHARLFTSWLVPHTSLI